MVSNRNDDHHRQRLSLVRVGWAAIGVVFFVMLIGCDQSPPVTEAIIVGDSMAPTLCGRSVEVTCPACGVCFSASQRSVEAMAAFECVNCGHDAIDPAAGSPLDADRVEVRPPSAEGYQRWDVVAFRHEENSDAAIKRIVGLPNEQLEIRDGDLFVAQRRLTKPLSVIRQLRIPVFDSAYVDDRLPPRLQPKSPTTSWQLADGCWRFDRHDRRANATNGLVYHPQSMTTELPDMRALVNDAYAFNQSLSRNFYETDDLFVQLDVSVSRDATFGLRFLRGKRRAVFLVERSEQRVSFLEDLGNDDSWRRVPFEFGDTGTKAPGATSQKVRVEFCSFDGQLQLWINAKEVCCFDSERARDEAVATVPFGIHTLGGDIGVDRFQLWRDVYYFDVSPDRANTGPALATGTDQFLLLGDNVPVSIDSRHWPQPAVKAQQLLGKVSVENPAEP